MSHSYPGSRPAPACELPLQELLLLLDVSGFAACWLLSLPVGLEVTWIPLPRAGGTSVLEQSTMLGFEGERL